ncbi:MAG: O-antigen ligase family protein [Deltaproteobacteria bacterium]|nr:O-antigen ligase family protein [Deltaproteobacteria bacterium]
MITKSRMVAADALLIILIGLATSLSMVVAAVQGSQWLLFIIFAFAGLAAALVLPQPQRFPFFLFLFFFSIPIGMDFYPIYIETINYRPLNGLRITLYELPFLYLFLAWAFQQVLSPEKKLKFFPWITIPFLLIWALTLAGLAFTAAPTVFKISNLWEVFFCWLVLLYLGNNLNQPKAIYIAVAALMSTLVFQSLIGFGQWVSEGLVGLGRVFGEGPHSFTRAQAGVFAISRVGGTVGHPNELAGYIGMILPINLALLFAPLDRRYKLLLILIGLMSFGILILTYSRGGWLSVIIGGLVTMYCCLAQLTRRKITSFILLAGFLSIFLFATLVFVTPIQKRLFEDDYGAARSRIPMSLLASNMIAHNPWLGVGLGNYTDVSSYYDLTREGISYTFNLPVHNEYLLIASELGLPALSIFLFLMVVVLILLIRLGRSRADPVIVYTAYGLFGGFIAWGIHQLFEYQHVMMSVQVWSLVGLILAMSRTAKGDTS